jgi:adenylate cyclase
MSEPSGATESALALQREILRSERNRAALVATFLAVALAIYLVVASGAMMSDVLNRGFVQQRPRVIAIFAIGIALELATWVYAAMSLRRSHQFPRWMPYIAVVVEAGLVTAMLAVAATVFEPSEVLQSPPSRFYFVIITLSALRLNATMPVFAGLISAAQYLLLAWWFRTTPVANDDARLTVAPIHYINSAGLFVLTGLATAFIAVQIRSNIERVLLNARQRDRAVRVFGQHVSPQVAGKLLSESTGRPELRQVCIMFLDIRGFSTFANHASPQEVMTYLNALFQPLIDCVSRHDGIINKFLGDGFMAVFGAISAVSPRTHCTHAIEASLAMLHTIDDLNSGDATVTTRVGIGLHAGAVVVGNVGSVERQEYTLVGDAVNVAARIEQATKDHAADVLVSCEVAKHVDAQQFGLSSVGRVTLRGQSDSIELFRMPRRTKRRRCNSPPL